MKEVDYIVLGLGIAGISFCDRLMQSGKSFVVVDEPLSSATKVAGGIVNPVVLKRLTPVWNANRFLEEALPFYTALQSHLGQEFFRETKIWRVFNDPEEQNEWMVASGRKKLVDFLTPAIKNNPFPSLHAPNGLGEMHRALQIDTDRLLSAYRSYLRGKGRWLQESFQYDRLEVKEDSVIYKDWVAKRIVFAEGAAVVQNPYFGLGSLIPKKGEYITIRSEELRVDQIIKGSFFVIPLGADTYKIGATFAHGDTAPGKTEKGKEQLIAAVKKIIGANFEVIDQEVGMRPTVSDRKPLLGSLVNDRIQFFNGLGTRGLLMAPLLSKMLLEHIEGGIPLPLEVNIRRFSSDRT